VFEHYGLRRNPSFRLAVLNSRRIGNSTLGIESVDLKGPNVAGSQGSRLQPEPARSLGVSSVSKLTEAVMGFLPRSGPAFLRTLKDLGELNRITQRARVCSEGAQAIADAIGPDLGSGMRKLCESMRARGRAARHAGLDLAPRNWNSA
jgi:hypothetical protein